MGAGLYRPTQHRPGRTDAAHEGFAAVLDADPDDRAARLYLDRIDHLRRDGPPRAGTALRCR